jgi:hypothetical protein
MREDIRLYMLAEGRINGMYVHSLIPTTGRRSDRSFRRTCRLATLLAVWWISHFTRDSDVPAQFAEDLVLMALQEERWADAKRLAEVALGRTDGTPTHHQLQVNLWMARQELDEDPEVLLGEVSAWTPPDELRYRLARAGLVGDEESVLVTLEAYWRAGELSQVLDWRLVRRMARQSKRVQQVVATRSFRGGQGLTNRRPRRRH